jgi:hypothetical protein
MPKIMVYLPNAGVCAGRRIVFLYKYDRIPQLYAL